MNNEKIVQKIILLLNEGNKIRVSDAHLFGSSETGFPRRIKDAENKLKRKIRRERMPVYRNDGQKVYVTEYSVSK